MPNKKRLVKILLLHAVMLPMLLFVYSFFTLAPRSWTGVDEAVVEKIAKEHGREARQPLINTDKGDLLLFIFLVAGAVGGFAGGYYWRALVSENSRNSRIKEYDDIVKFHGHRCPGLAIGYRMTLAAMTALGVSRAGDEELVAIVENDACGVDALQFLSGCTFGKGNLIFRDYGKPVFTLFSRTSGKGVRVLFCDAALPAEQRGDPEQRLAYILAAPDEAILSVSDVPVAAPKKARIFTTVCCDICHEPVMETRLQSVAGTMFCVPCAEKSAGPDRQA